MSLFLLVHGAWHDRRCWESVALQLQSAGHRVVTPDLPGHGQSSLAPSRVSLKHYVNALLELIDNADEPVHLVGHSMAGVPVTVVAAERPSRVASLTYVAAYLPQPGDSVFDLIVKNRGHEPLVPIELAMVMSADKRTCTIEFDQVIPLFYGATEPALAAAARDRLQVQGSLPLAAAARYDPLALQVLPRRYLCCSRDRVLPLHHQRRMLVAEPGIDVDVLDSDHSPFFSQPALLVRQLLAPCSAAR